MMSLVASCLMYSILTTLIEVVYRKHASVFWSSGSPEIFLVVIVSNLCRFPAKMSELGLSPDEVIATLYVSNSHSFAS